MQVAAETSTSASAGSSASRLPAELILRIFQYCVCAEGAVPFMKKYKHSFFYFCRILHWKLHIKSTSYFYHF